MRSFSEFKKLCEATGEESPGKLAALARMAADANLRKQLKQDYKAANKEAEAAQADFEAATVAQAESDIVRDAKGKPVPKTRPYYLQNNPAAAREHEARKIEAEDALAAAQAAIDDASQRAADIEAQLASEDPRAEMGRQQSERAAADAEAAAMDMM